MRAALAIAAVAAAGWTALLLPVDSAAGCSAFDRRPCAPTVCSVFRRRPCTPDFEPPIGQDLRLTIVKTQVAAAHTGDDSHGDVGAEHKLDSIRDLFDALRACSVELPTAEKRDGMQVSVRLSFKRNGEIIGTPRRTFATREAPPEVKDAYYKAVTEALERCAPFAFTDGFGGAIAGRPIAIRYVDDRMQEEP